MTKERVLEIKSQLQDILKEIKEDEDHYFVYKISGIYRAINDLDFYAKNHFE